MSTFSNWTPNELDYLLSLDDSELQSTLEGMPEEDRQTLTSSLLNRVEELKHDEFVGDKESLGQRLEPPISGTMVARYEKRGMRLDGPPYSVLASQAEYDRVRKESGVDDGGTDAELRRQRMQAEIAEKLQSVRSKQIKNDQADRRLVAREEVVQEFSDFLQHAATLLEGFPDQVAKESPEDMRVKTREMAQNVADQLLTKLSSWTYQP